MRRIKLYQFGGTTYGQYNAFGNKLAVQNSAHQFQNYMQSYLNNFNPQQNQYGNMQFTVGDASTGFMPYMTQNTPYGTQITNMLTAQTQTDYGGGIQLPKMITTPKHKEGAAAGGIPGSASTLGGIAQGVGFATNILNGFIDHKGGDDTNESGQQAIGNALMSSGDPTAMVVGAVWNGLSAIGSASGLNSNKLTSKQANKVGANGWIKFANNALSYMPLAGAFMNKTTNANKSIEVDKVRDAYSGTADDIDTANTMGGKRYVNSNDINNFVGEQNQRNKLLTDISSTNTLRKQSNYGLNIKKQNFKQYNGSNYQSTAIGKEGMKLLSKEELSKIYTIKKRVTSYQNGGSILIPDGALHAHKHHMEKENPELAEELTKKGIPVVVTNENGEVTQVAEIEKQEIILEKSLTNKVEDLWHKGNEEAMIECGKLIVDTLFSNCDDNANLVKEVA